MKESAVFSILINLVGLVAVTLQVLPRESIPRYVDFKNSGIIQITSDRVDSDESNLLKTLNFPVFVADNPPPPDSDTPGCRGNKCNWSATQSA